MNKLLLATACCYVAWSSMGFAPVPMMTTKRHYGTSEQLFHQRGRVLSATNVDSIVGSGESILHELNFVLGEGTGKENSHTTPEVSRRRTFRRRRVTLTIPEKSFSAGGVTLTSSASVAESVDYDQSSAGDEVWEGDEDEGEVGFTMELQKNADSVAREERYRMRQKMDQRRSGMFPSIRYLWSEEDYVGIIQAYTIPVVALGAFSYIVGKKGMLSFGGKRDAALQGYADEMVYHDGDFEEMKMCHADWKRKLTAYFAVGPVKKNKMLSKYLEVYAKKKPVSPKAISSLSYAFSIYKLTEQKAAKILCQVAERIKDKPASAGKLLFFGRHILKTPEAKASLEPIKTMLSSSYRAGGEMFVEQAQKTMGEAAYKAAVVAAGSEQKSLTPGWEVLGLDEETASRIFAEVAEDDFMSDTQKLYREQKWFDEKGRRIDKDGNLLDPDDPGDGNDVSSEDNSDAPAGTVYECSECGYTMFPAKGREFKFIPDDFQCPECGAEKKKFVDRSSSG